MSDVNHPPHYGGEENTYEVIKVLEHWLTPEEFRGGLKFNIFKYLARSRLKGDHQKDHQKAEWYARYLIEWEARTGGVK